MAFLNVLPGAVCPTIEVSLDVGDPTVAIAGATWRDITPYLVGYSRAPVRTNEFDQPGPASSQITLRNEDGRFIPDNAGGAYYPNLKPYRRVRVRAQWAGVTYNRYLGHVTDWPQTWDQYGRDQHVTLQLTDALTPIEVTDLQGQSFTSKLSGAALLDVLNAAYSPAVPVTSLDAGSSTIVASGVLGVGSFALQRAKDIAASENGVFFAAGDGTLTFHDRHRRLIGGRSAAVQATIGDGGGAEIPYVDPQPAYGDVWPIVQVTPNGGTLQVANAGTTGSYFGRTLNFPTSGTYLVAAPTEALAAAQYLSQRYGNPITRIRALTIVGAAAPALWPTILGLDVSDKVIFKRRYLVNGAIAGTISLTEFVEGYGEDVAIGKDWRISLPLSPADSQSYWLLQDAVYGLLGQMTRLGY